MLMLKSKELREKRAKLIADVRELLNHDLTAETRTKVNTMNADVDQITADIATYEDAERRERAAAVAGGAPITGGDADVEARKAAKAAEARKYTDAFETYLRGGLEAMSPEQRSILRQGEVKEQRAQTITTTGGGYTVPQGFMTELEKAQLYYADILRLARVLSTTSGASLPWPTVDDTANSGEDKAINTAAAAQDVTFGQKTLGSHKIGSGLILVPTELFEDTGLNLQDELVNIMAERLGRRRAAKYAVGAGTTDFQGFVVGASAGLTFASATAMTADELISIQHKVDKAYRSSPKCGWAMNDDTVRYIRQLKDSYGRYLLDPALEADGFDRILGKPVAVSNDMETIAAGKKTVAFGDFSKFIIRNVRSVVVRRMDEKYADADQVGFVAWYRGDSQVICASSKALVINTQAAS